MKIKGTSSAARPANGRVLSVLNRFSLRSLLMGSTSLVVLFCLLVVVYLHTSQTIVFRMVDRLIHVDNEILDLALKSTAAMINARQAMPQGGTVEIDLRNETIAEGSNPLVPSGGGYVRIDVKDSGEGISTQHLARIFDPYFTTKETGSGLGLATSYSIIRNHGGFIDVSSSVGRGSVFTVYLPANPAATATDESEALIPDSSAPCGRNILVMDDDQLVRNLATDMLTTIGCTVTTAPCGEEAIRLFQEAQKEGTPFDLVILDLTVKGGMGGEETIRRLREIDPKVKAVVSSGYSDAAVLADYRAHGFSACLNKPYRITDLKACLHSLLG